LPNILTNSKITLEFLDLVILLGMVEVGGVAWSITGAVSRVLSLIMAEAKN
jgi:hypothetical protein